MGYFNFKWQVYSASATRRTYDRNTIRARLVVQVHPGSPSNMAILAFPLSGNTSQKPICQLFANFRIGRMALHSGR
jgi:hypothetical protein